MGFKNNCYCTVWEIDKNNHKAVNVYDKYADIQITISKKKKDGTYETDFSGKVRLITKAFDKIKEVKLNAKDRLKLLEVEVTNRYEKETQKTYENFVCYDLEILDSKKKNINDVEVITPVDTSDTKYKDDDLPF